MVNPESLPDAEAAAYWWLVNRFLCQELASSEHRSRVLVVDGRRLADSPIEVLPAVMRHAGLLVDGRLVESLVRHPSAHPSAHKHSKDPSMFYDAESRRQEMQELELRYGAQANKARSI